MTNDSLKYLLDTNVCIQYLNGRSLLVRERLHSLTTKDIAVCSVVKSELFYGSMRSNNPSKNLEQQKKFLNQFLSLPFDDNCAEVYGKIRAELAKVGTPIGSNDLQIASIALVNDLNLVTHNIGEFERIKGLKVEDWEES